MKISKLLVLSALWLAAGSAMADIVGGVRVKPVPQTTGFVLSADTTQNYYLYNVTAQMFFAEGNNYNTRGSVANTTGNKVAFTQYAEGAEGVYIWNDFSPVKNAWKEVFFNDPDQIYVDRNGQPNYGWSVEDNGATFRIHASDDATISPDYNWSSYQNQYVGVNFSIDPKTALTPILAEKEGNNIDWAYVTAENYAAYLLLLSVYEKAQELKAVIDEANDKGIDVSAQETVYLTEDATMDQLEAAIAAVNEAIAAHIEGSVDNPTLMTNLVNGNFPGTADGWKGTVPGLAGNGEHADAEVAEHYNKTFDTYQNLGGMPKGVFRLNAKTFYRGSYNDFISGVKSNAYMYATANGDTLTTPFNNAWSPMNTESFVDKYGSTTYFGTKNVEGKTTDNGVTYYIPDNPSTFRLYCEEEGQNYYDTNLFFSVEEGNEMTIGVKKEVAVGGDWSVFDEFQLYYYGNDADAYQLWLESSKVDYSEQASAMYVEPYEEAFNVTVSDKAGVLAALKNAQLAEDSIAANIKLWNEYTTKVDEGLAKAVSEAVPDGQEKDDLSDYCEFDADDYIKAMELSNEELRAEMAKLEELIKAANSAVKDGTDVTAEYLKNANFDNGSANWTVGKGNVAFRENIAEAYNTDFDVYQEVLGAAVGVYEIKVQGFFRMKRDAEAWALYDGKEQKTDAGVYVNDNKTSLMCIFDDGIPTDSPDADSRPDNGWMKSQDVGGDRYYPDNMTTAAYAFGVTDEAGLYKYYNNTVYGLVANQGDTLRIGVKGNVTGENWICFDNIRMIKQGYSPDVVVPFLEAKINEADSLVLYELMATSVKSNLETLMATAKEAKDNAEEDRSAAFHSLSALIVAINEANASIKECAALYKLNEEELLNAINENQGSDWSTQAEALYTKIADDFVTMPFGYDTSDIAAYTLKIKEMILKLGLPANYDEASDESPKDLTGFIKTPSFQKTVNGAETNSIDGWEGTTGYNFGNDVTQKGALALEFYEKTFDMYQDVTGVGEVVLPNGRYEVTVNGFERVNDNTPAYFYAQSGDSIAVKELLKLKVKNEATGEEGDGINDMVSAVTAFGEGKYLNSLVITVNNNELRIGIKHEKNSSYDWIIMDNFKLIYHGTESNYQGIETLETLPEKQAVKVEYFAIDGRKATAVQKGIVIKKVTMKDGSIVVKKMSK